MIILVSKDFMLLPQTYLLSEQLDLTFVSSWRFRLLVVHQHDCTCSQQHPNRLQPSGYTCTKKQPATPWISKICFGEQRGSPIRRLTVIAIAIAIPQFHRAIPRRHSRKPKPLSMIVSLLHQRLRLLSKQKIIQKRRPAMPECSANGKQSDRVTAMLEIKSRPRKDLHEREAVGSDVP